MKKRLPGIIIFVFLLALLVRPAYSQSDYSFRVDRAVVNYYVNQDGTASVDYTYDFVNNPGAHPIDYVDIGLPNDSYDLGSIKADVDGVAITDIEKSSFVSHGVALGLGANAIQPGRSGRVHAWIPVIQKIAYPADKSSGKADYASVQFSPNYFDGKYVTGTTDLTVTLILPPGMTQDEPVYYTPQNWPGSEQPEAGFTQDNRVFYTWQNSNANSHSEYVFGAGFPAKLVPAAAIVKPPLINIPTETFCCFGFAALFAGIFGLSIYSNRRRKLAYLPPKISVEGHGIKRGLTPVEVAVLMEQPVDKVMTMTLFSVVKKGAARVAVREPLKLEFAAQPPQGLNTYETDFLTAFKTDDPKERRKSLQDVMVGLVKAVTEKMRGFSRKETIAYYDSIMQQAWQQVEAAQTPEIKSQKYDEVMDWTMLDKNYTDRTRDVFRTGPVFVPTWWGNFDPTFRPSSSGTSTVSQPSSGGGGGGGGGLSMPTLPGADFAASMVNGVQTFAAGVIGDLGAFTGGVSKVTNPPPPPPPPGTTFRGGGGGGHSCACACACAGCACACAGGGR